MYRYLKMFLIYVFMCVGMCLMSEENVMADTGSVTYDGTYRYDNAYEVLEMVNAERQSAGLTPLTMDMRLLEAAMQRAAEINLYFSHTRPDGSACYSLITNVNGYPKGENIAAGQASPTAVMTSWMNSEGHKANILNGGYKSIGIGCFTQGGILYWTQVFAGAEAVTGVQPANREVTCTVNVDTAYLSSDKIEFVGSYDFKIGSEVEMSARVINTGWSYSKCKLNPSSFNWTSNNTELARIDNNGKVTPLYPGEVTITAALKAAPYTGISYTKTVTGNPADVNPLKCSLKINGVSDNLNVNVGQSVNMTAKASGGGKEYTYSFLIWNRDTDSWYRFNKSFTSVNTMKWNSNQTGRRVFFVEAKDEYGNLIRSKGVGVNVKNAPLTISGKSNVSTVSLGESVTITGTASGGAGKYTYSFLLCNKDTGEWYRFGSSFKAENKLTWKAKTLGTRLFFIEVKDAKGTKVRSTGVKVNTQKIPG